LNSLSFQSKVLGELHVRNIRILEPVLAELWKDITLKEYAGILPPKDMIPIARDNAVLP